MPSASDTQTDFAAEIEARITAVWAVLTREFPGGLSRTAGSVLGILRREGPQRVTTLAAREHVAQPSMSVLVQRLERRGLVERHDDPADRRACRVAITPAGDEILRDRAQERTSRLRARLERLGTDERHAIERALAQLDHLLNDDDAEDTHA